MSLKNMSPSRSLIGPQDPLVSTFFNFCRHILLRLDLLYQNHLLKGQKNKYRYLETAYKNRFFFLHFTPFPKPLQTTSVQLRINQIKLAPTILVGLCTLYPNITPDFHESRIFLDRTIKYSPPKKIFFSFFKKSSDPHITFPKSDSPT